MRFVLGVRVGLPPVRKHEDCAISSYEEPTVDALAPDADEGRGWLRKATGSCRPSFDPWMSEWGNPAPVMGCHPCLNEIGQEEGTGGTETSQYLEERKATATP